VLHGAQVSAVPADLGTISARAARSLVVSGELVESAQREGYEAGYATGHDQGYNDGISQAHDHAQLLADLTRRLSDAADALLTRETTARAEIEDAVVATAFRIAEVIVGREITVADDRGRNAIARALRLAPERGLVTARLHPADAAVIDPEHLSLGRAIEVVPDPAVAPGDCVVEVGACRVDARIEPALERIRELLS
jgi:flagellar assembly protein FliH